MKISERSIAALAKVVTGDSSISPYNSGPNLVRIFNEFGANDVYGQGFPSRWFYAEDKLRTLNGSEKLDHLIREVLDPRDWPPEKPRENAVAFLNDYFKFDGYELVPHGDLSLPVHSGVRLLSNIRLPPRAR